MQDKLQIIQCQVVQFQEQDSGLNTTVMKMDKIVPWVKVGGLAFLVLHMGAHLQLIQSLRPHLVQVVTLTGMTLAKLMAGLSHTTWSSTVMVIQTTLLS